MTAKTITQLTALAAADAASADVLPIVDVSDTTMAATGTTKKITLTDLQSAPVSAGVANGVLYLNDSKVATSGSALTYNGVGLGIGVASASQLLNLSGAGTSSIQVASTDSGGKNLLLSVSGSLTSIRELNGSPLSFDIGGSEQMRLTSTGLGIGTSSPSYKLDIHGPAGVGLRVFETSTGTNKRLLITQESSYVKYEATYSTGDNAHSWWIGGARRMDLDANGNLGIGTSSPSARSHTSESNPTRGVIAKFANSATSAQTGCQIQLTQSGIADWAIGQPAGTNAFAFWSGRDKFGSDGTERLRIDASGNLGLGVTPSAWHPSIKAIDINTCGSVVASGNAIELYLNSYWDGASFKYKSTDIASKYEQSLGAHKWYTAPSGTAGNAISFTQAMTLDASGNLNIGQTSAGTINANGLSLFVSLGAIAYNHLSGTSSGTVYANFGYAGTAIGSITQSGTTAVAYNTSSDYRLKDNQSPLTGSGAFIDALKPKTWNWKADGSKGVGFIAHEVQEVSPTSVVGEKDAMRVEQYEVSPAVPATYDEQGNELTPAVEAVMGEREVPAYQAMEYGSAEFIANIVAELQSLRKRVAALEA